jgi:hypothetical protein
LLKSIKTTETRADFLESIDMEISELRKNNFQVYFYGDKSHIFHYLYPGTNLNINSFFQPLDDLVYYPKIEQIINKKQRVVVFLIDSYPGNVARKQTPLEVALIKDGFDRIVKGSLVYYLKLKNNLP